MAGALLTTTTPLLPSSFPLSRTSPFKTISLHCLGQSPRSTRVTSIGVPSTSAPLIQHTNEGSTRLSVIQGKRPMDHAALANIAARDEPPQPHQPSLSRLKLRAAASSISNHRLNQKEGPSLIQKISSTAVIPPLHSTSFPYLTSTPVANQPKKTFSDVVSDSWSKEIDVSFASSFHPRLSSYKGEPALLISKEEEDQLATPFKLTLVGKFFRGRPSMAALRKEVLAIGFNGKCDIGLLDQKHILFKFELESDFLRMWLKKEWNFHGFSATIFRWTKDFCPDIDSSIAPVWVRFPLLPIHICNKQTLFSLGSVVGTPLKLDLASAAAERILRPSEARICIQIDVLKPTLTRVWIGNKDKGRWQRIEVEEMPFYCSVCHRLGHAISTCKIAHPPPKSMKVWAPKNRADIETGKEKEVDVRGCLDQVPPRGMSVDSHLSEAIR